MPAALRPVATQLFAALQRSIGQEEARNELRWMAQGLLVPRTDSDGCLVIENMLRRRVKGEPLQYILGSQPFGPLNVLTRPPILIPRPETEDWTIRLSDRLASWHRTRTLTLLDLCTGSGCIPLLLCHLLPSGSLHATGVDVSGTAVQLCHDNASSCGIAVPAAPVAPTTYGAWMQNTFLPLLGNIRDPAFPAACGLCPPYDVITSNPPYITRDEYDSLPSSVKNWEDPRALLGDPDTDGRTSGDGLTFYHAIASLSLGLLKPDGMVVLEVGQGQADAVAQILEETAPMKNIEIWKDPWDMPRVVVGNKLSER